VKRWVVLEKYIEAKSGQSAGVEKTLCERSRADTKFFRKKRRSDAYVRLWTHEELFGGEEKLGKKRRKKK